MRDELFHPRLVGLVAALVGCVLGAALLPLSVGLAVLSPLAGAISAKVGVRAMLTAGPLIVAAGFGLPVR